MTIGRHFYSGEKRYDRPTRDTYTGSFGYEGGEDREEGFARELLRSKCSETPALSPGCIRREQREAFPLLISVYTRA